VAEAVLRGRRQERFLAGGVLDDLRRGAVAAVGEEQGFEVGPGGPHEGRAVGDDVRHHVLVGKDDAGRGLGDPQGADEAPLEHAVGVPLLVDVQGGYRVGREDALVEPAAEGVGGLLVAGAGRGRLREDQPDDVVRVRVLEVVQAVGADHDVVRRGGDGGETSDPVGVVAQASERGEFQASGRRRFRVTC
jgi:hypothetical protein